MSSRLGKLFQKIWGGKLDFRALVVGLDAAGKTTILYKLKLGEIVTTIPTIGFNVETIDYDNISFTMWDVGGCDKIRPLYRHYFQQTQVLIWVIDCNDRERMHESKEEFDKLIAEDVLRDSLILIYANKQDLPNALTSKEIINVFKLQDLRRPWYIQSSCATSGDGLYEGLAWASLTLKSRNDPFKQTTTQQTEDPVPPPESIEKNNDEYEKNFLKWLHEDEDSEDEFVDKIENSPEKIIEWDHRSLLRLIWCWLKKEERRIAIKKIFSQLKKISVNFPVTINTNETWTYFWIQIIHYAMMSTNKPTQVFVEFLFLHPQILNERLPFDYYNEKTIMSEEAVNNVILPDKKPLPSIVPKSTTSSAPSISTSQTDNDDETLSDDELLERFESYSLTRWDHRTHLRVAWCYLTRYGRKDGSKKIFSGIENFITNSKVSRKTTFHVTMTYFWIQMVDYAIASTPNCKSFDQFISQNPKLMEGGLFLEYYKKDTMLNNPEARRMFVLPDVKPLPNVVPKKS